MRNFEWVPMRLKEKNIQRLKRTYIKPSVVDTVKVSRLKFKGEWMDIYSVGFVLHVHSPWTDKIFPSRRGLVLRANGIITSYDGKVIS